MKCPRCETMPLKAEQMRDLSVDACPQCQGIWVRRRDLESLIGEPGDREELHGEAREGSRRFDGDDDDDRFADRNDAGKPKGKRKGGWLQNIGDMLGGD